MTKLKTWIAPALSGGVFPGLGQFYNRQFLKGTAFLLSFSACILYLAVLFSSIGVDLMALHVSPDAIPWAEAGNKNLGRMVLDLLAMVLIWGASVLDAYLHSKKRLNP